MSAPQPGTPRTIYVQWSVDGNHIRKWSWSEFDLAERLNAETVSVSDPKAQALADALREALEQSFTHYTARNGRKCSIEGEDGEQCLILPFEATNNLRAALADWEGK